MNKKKKEHVFGEKEQTLKTNIVMEWKLIQDCWKALNWFLQLFWDIILSRFILRQSRRSLSWLVGVFVRVDLINRIIVLAEQALRGWMALHPVRPEGKQIRWRPLPALLHISGHGPAERRPQHGDGLSPDSGAVHHFSEAVSQRGSAPAWVQEDLWGSERILGGVHLPGNHFQILRHQPGKSRSRFCADTNQTISCLE